MLIGQKVKELRKKQKMSLSELSQKSGVQIATLSRIEHMRMVGTLESHIQIAKALGVDVTQLYQEVLNEGKLLEVKTAPSPADVFVHSAQSSYEMLTNKILEKKMMPILLKIEPGGQTNTEQNPPETEKFVFVLEGKIEVKIGQESYPLSKNNSLYFDASLAHYFINIGKTAAKVICVSTPVAL